MKGTSETLHTSRIFKALTLAGGFSSLILSIIYLVILLCPHIIFTGYIHGYLSLTSYELRYNTNGGFISLPNLDVVRVVSFTATIHTIVVMISTVIALLMLRRSPFTSASTVYGSSLSLLVASGVLRYLSQAFSLDVGRLMQYANNGPFRFKTLAGLVEYPGITAERTMANALLFDQSWLIVALLYASIVLSLTAITWALFVHKTPEKNIESHQLLRIFKPLRREPLRTQALSSIILMLMLLQTSASVFAYYPYEVLIKPVPPPLILDHPPYNYTGTSIIRAIRGAITFTDFETYPVPGWVRSGGGWSNVSGVAGAKGNVLQGSDDGDGLGGASYYYYNTDLSSYTSLWIVAKMRYEAGGDGWYGISLIESDRDDLITIVINRISETAGYFEIWRCRRSLLGWDWDLYYRTSITGYREGNWYVVAVYFSTYETGISISAHLYDVSGRYITSASESISWFRSAYIGVHVDNLNALFDDFIISTSDPRSILFAGFTIGMRVEVWDNLGKLVNSTIALTSSFYMNVTSDVVVGTGVDGRIVVRYPDGFPCVVYTVPSTDAVLGGDAYSLVLSPMSVTLGVNGTSAVISANISASSLMVTSSRFIRVNNTDGKPYYVRLTLSPLSSLGRLYANISLINSTSATTVNITIVNGVAVSNATSWIAIQPGATINATFSAYFPSTGQSAMLYMLLEYSTLPGGQGVCVYYPIELRLRTSS